MIGKTLAHYKVVASLGKGGMGEVYVGEQGRASPRPRSSLRWLDVLGAVGALAIVAVIAITSRRDRVDRVPLRG